MTPTDNTNRRSERHGPIPEARRTVMGMCACLVVVLLWFSPWWAAGRHMAPLDILNEMMTPWRQPQQAPVQVKNHTVADGVTQYLIYRMVAAESYKREGWFGWSSLKYGGSPEYANTMALYYDWSMQLHRWFDFWTAWHLGLLLQVLIAAWGMLFLLRDRLIGPLWATCGALAYAANSQFVIWIYHRWALGSFCWVPWMLWAIHAFNSGRKGFGFWVPAFTALAMLGGTLQHCAMIAMVAYCAWLADAIGTAQGRQPLGERRTLVARARAILAQPCRIVQLKVLRLHCIWMILGCGLASMMLLPCVDAFITTNRLGLHTVLHGMNPGKLYPEGSLQPLLNLLSYPFHAFPSLAGRCDSVDALKLFKSKITYLAFFGTLPVIIGFICLWKRDTPVIARVLMACGLIIPLTPLVRFLYQRLLILFIVGGIIAFADYMQNASRDSKKKLAGTLAKCLCAVAAAWCAASVFFQLKHDAILNLLITRLSDRADGSAFGYFHDWMIGRFATFAGDLRIWSPHQLMPLALVFLGILALRLTASPSERRHRLGSWMLVACILSEVTLFGARWVVFTDPKIHPAYRQTPESLCLQRLVGSTGRVKTLIKNDGGHMAITPFVPNTLSAYGIATIDGYDSIVPNGLWLSTQDTTSPALLARAGVSHLITYPGNIHPGADWNQVWHSPAMVVYANTIPSPRYLGFETSEDINVYLRNDACHLGTPLREVSGLENSRLIEIPESIRCLRISENQSDGWVYSTDRCSSWKPASRAPDGSMILNLDSPEYRHSSVVRMQYEPPLRRWGFVVSLTALIFCAAGAILTTRPTKQAIPSQ